MGYIRPPGRADFFPSFVPFLRVRPSRPSLALPPQLPPSLSCLFDSDMLVSLMLVCPSLLVALYSSLVADAFAIRCVVSLAVVNIIIDLVMGPHRCVPPSFLLSSSSSLLT